MPRHTIGLRTIAVLLLLVGAFVLTSAPGPVFTARDKAFYADENLVNFVRPGLQIRIQSAVIETDGTIRVRYRLTDPRGLGLDRLGVTTPGTITTSFVAATIPAGQTQYVAYTTRVQGPTPATSPVVGATAIQAAGQNNGTFRQIADGEYEYTFSVRAPATIDRNATHSIGIYGSRNLTEFNLGVNYADAVFNFVPNGGPVRVVRDVVTTASCNKCHEQLAFHGGSRRSMELCILCHTPQTIDPDTGNTQDMPVLIHKIHMGKDLPSVKAGKPYIVIGNQQSVHDYSKVAFPPDAPADVSATRNCILCHEQEGPRAASQANRMFAANRAACGACHDDVNFATGQGHVNLPQVSDSQCTNCHIPQGELDRDASIIGAHRPRQYSSFLPGLVADIIRVDDGLAGKRPTVTFSLKDKKGNPVLPSQTARLFLVLAGPTTDYRTYLSEDIRQAQGSNGIYFWTFANPLPPDAKGTYSVGIEGYRNVILLEGTAKQETVRDATPNKVMHFSVDGSRLEPRRQIVSLAKCNACHLSLSLHGFNRNTIEQCVLCHHPLENDRARRPAAQMPPESVDMRMMTHRIHTGADQGRDYTIYGFGGTPHNYNDVRLPMSPANCAGCHVNGSENLPLRENLLAVDDPRGRIKKPGPETAACLSCHTSRAAAAHAAVNTSAELGESCSACHGANSEFSVGRVHAR